MVDCVRFTGALGFANPALCGLGGVTIFTAGAGVTAGVTTGVDAGF